MHHEKLDRKFFAVTIIWFVISYLILWFIGGACLNPINGSACLAQDALLGARSVPVLGLLFPFDAWVSLMYFVLPIIGYFFAIFIISWWNKEFETKEASTVAFPIILIVLVLAAFMMNLAFYNGEAASMNSNNGVKYTLYFCLGEAERSQCNDTVYRINNELYAQAQSRELTTVPQNFPVAFWPELRKSVFFIFALGALFGWVPVFVRNLMSKKEKSD